MISLRRIHHVCLRVDDLGAAAQRWSIQFGLTVRDVGRGRAYLACDYEPYSLELVAGGVPGFDHSGWELARGISLDAAAAHLDSLGVGCEWRDGALHFRDPDGH